MRISGGVLKGRNVASRKAFSAGHGSDELRPTSAKVREAIFDILRSEIQGSVFLDLYAGTGAVGIEALSRGAGRIILVEKNHVRSQAVRDYIKEIKASDRASICREKAEYFLKRAAAAGATFDIIFADPPYSSDEMSKIFDLLKDNDVLKDGGTLIVEHHCKSRMPENTHPFSLVKNYRYGDTMLTLYRKEK
ncbi:MAG: 16S rRNA (guanine(966)-N(2))-methyltransferase RsmD [Nitrospirota bacterium]